MEANLESGSALLYIRKLHPGLLVSVSKTGEVFNWYYSLRCQGQNKLAVSTDVRMQEKVFVLWVTDRAGFCGLVLKGSLFQADGMPVLPASTSNSICFAMTVIVNVLLVLLVFVCFLKFPGMKYETE